jgi:predicted ATPase
MRFYQTTHPNHAPPPGAEYPCAILVQDSWNDFGYRTQFNVHLYRGQKDRVFDGTVKILQRNPEAPTTSFGRTSLPDTFTVLPADFCSLGQRMVYYEAIASVGEDLYEPFLSGLRDTVYDPQLRQLFAEVLGFRLSLLRFSEAEKAFEEAHTFFDGLSVHQVFRFSFSCTVPHATAAHEVAFDFSHHPTELHRTAVIIGKNGTGKTQYLAQFALAMSGLGRAAEGGATFSPRRPSFSRVLAVSYSAFDDFARPSEYTASYKYCGIRSTQSLEEIANRRSDDSIGDWTHARLLSSSELTSRLREAREAIQSQGRDDQWNDIITVLLEGTLDPTADELSDLTFYHRLSSGQRILVATMTDIVAYITKQSVVLFDEPELHLHPEVFAALARAIDRLLHHFDSFAIIATHSPLLLQETLARQVRIFRRRGDTPVVSPLTVESFGENLSTITSEVFAVEGSHHNFRAHLDSLLTSRTPLQVEALFPLGLPLQALAYLRARNRADDE